MKKRVPVFLVGVGVFAAFIFFSYIVHKDFFTQLDFDTTVRLQDKIPRRLDEFFSLFSTVGKFGISLLILLVLLIPLILRKKFLAVLAFVAFGFLHIIELYGKFFVDHPPPPEFLLRTREPFQFPDFYVRAEYSYPSGHAARAAFLTILIGLIILKSKKLNQTQKMFIIGLLFIYDIVMFTSRIYLGEHWLSDVLGGALLGAGFALLSSVFIVQ